MEFAAARNVAERNRGDSLNGLGKCFAGRLRKVLARCAAADPVRDCGIKEGNFPSFRSGPRSLSVPGKGRSAQRQSLIFDVGTFGGAGTDFNFHVVSFHAGCRRSMAASNCFASGFSILLMLLVFSSIRTDYGVAIRVNHRKRQIDGVKPGSTYLRRSRFTEYTSAS